jgi:DNA repair exonuclease SbcCD ATPase subunit
VKVLRIDVRRLPGIEPGFGLDRLSPGLNLVLGPNGSGKSSLARALRATLWPGRAGIEGADVVSTWQLEPGESEARQLELEARLGREVEWRCGASTANPPLLPPDHLAPAYFLRLGDLLAEEGDDDLRLAEEIRVQLAGGYDLAALHSSIRPAHHGRKSESELVSADRALRALKGERRDLATEQDGLRELRERLAGARAAHLEADLLTRCIELGELRGRSEAFEASLEGYCAAHDELERLSGTEGVALDRIDDDLERLAAEMTASRRRIAEANREIAESALPRGAAEPSELAALRPRLRELERLATRLAALDEEAAATRAARAAAARMFAGEAVDLVAAAESPLTGAELDDLEQALTRALTLRERRALLEARIQDCAERDAAGEGGDALERLTRAAGLVREWLGTGPARPLWPLLVLASLCCASLGGLGWALLRAPELAVAAGVIAGGLVTSWLVALGSRIRARRARRNVERRFEAEGLGALEVSDPGEQLRALEARAALATAARRAGEERAALAPQRDALDDALHELAHDRAHHVAWLGGPAARGDLAFADWLDRLRRWRVCEAKAAEVEELCVERSAALREELAELGEWLEQWVGRRPGDVAEAVALMDELDERSRCLRELSRSRASAERELEALRERVDVLDARRRELLEAAGLAEARDPRVELARRLDDLPAHREAAEALRGLRARIHGLEERLQREGGSLDLEPLEAERQRVELESRAAGADALAERIGAVEERVRAAGESGELAERRAHAQRAREAMLERRREVALATAGDWLLEGVAAEYEQASRPKVLERAAELFRAFTRGRFELISPAVGAAGGLRARDTASDVERALDELSDGTRTQLLLAARLAFVDVEERGARPPLLLDEALTATDPERFEAVARAVLAMVGQGRQVFYLTCSPSDVALFERIARDAGAPAPRIVDLGRVRSGSVRRAPIGNVPMPPAG